VGLKANGTVVATGWNAYHQSEVATWSDIVAVATGIYHSVGLKRDGTVVVTAVSRSIHRPNSPPTNDHGQCDVAGWSGIVAVAAGPYHTVGLKADGSVVAVGYSGDGAPT